MFTVENTVPDFFWVTNYIETILSNVLWKACTSATTAYRFRKTLEHFAESTGGDKSFIDWQGHDFSFRGMSGPEDAALSGAGHLLSFTGTDTVPAIQLLDRYYGGENNGLIGGSVAATEHSVMCAGGREDELETFRRLLDLYPTGILSVVSDTWDLWHVLSTILPQLKDQILARQGKLVIRPDSGNPADILCGPLPSGNSDVNVFVAAHKGVIESLWDLFGGTTNDKGYKVLNPRVGAIYGDSIDTDRASEILQRLQAKGFASTNVVFGCGSFNYQYVTRDTYGFAMKATWAQVNGAENTLYKDPITDDGGKKSARGRLAVYRDAFDGDTLKLVDDLSLDGEKRVKHGNELSTVWQNGKFTEGSRIDLASVRRHLKYT
jgi:nicotinamide phosphoribosyltransferase